MINKIIFGSDIDPNIKSKLSARSQASKRTVNPNESIFKGVQPSNFEGVGELSSKTPIARLWTAVKLTRNENLVDYVEKTRQLSYQEI